MYKAISATAGPALNAQVKYNDVLLCFIIALFVVNMDVMQHKKLNFRHAKQDCIAITQIKRY